MNESRTRIWRNIAITLIEGRPVVNECYGLLSSVDLHGLDYSAGRRRCYCDYFASFDVPSTPTLKRALDCCSELGSQTAPK